MTEAKKFSIYLAQMRFLDSEVQKLRPVIAVSKPHGKYKVLVAIPVSSQSIQTEVDVNLSEWSAAGLLKTSVARVHRLTAVLQADLVEEIGEITPMDKSKVQKAIKKLLEL